MARRLITKSRFSSRRLITLMLLGASMAGCSAGTGSSRAAGSTTEAGGRAGVRPPTTVAAPPGVDWSQLHNPIVRSGDHAVKDAALMAVNGRWFAAFSTVDTHGTWRIGIEHSATLHTWSSMSFMPHDPTVEGEASPDVVRAPGGAFVITYQSFVHDSHGGLAKLYYRTTPDFVHFSPPHQLLRPVLSERSDRLIDPTLAWTPAGLLLGFKIGTDAQAFELARSKTGTLAGPWAIVGRPDIRVFGDTIENYQFIEIDGRWKLLATSNQLDRPFLFDLAGDVRVPSGWLRWSAGRELHVPQEAWNTGSGITGSTFEHANCAYLVDQRSQDGHFYLLYEDASDMTSFGGQGHGALALARSTDLTHWSVPPA